MLIPCLEPPHIHTKEMAQRRAARWTLCRFSSYDSVSDMLGELRWRSLEDRRTESRLCLFYKIVQGLVAVPLPPYVVHTQVFTRHSASHLLAFRQSTQLLPLLPLRHCQVEYASSKHSISARSWLVQTGSQQSDPLKALDRKHCFYPFIFAFCLHQTFLIFLT